jgi:hypothetical protein
MNVGGALCELVFEYMQVIYERNFRIFQFPFSLGYNNKILGNSLGQLDINSVAEVKRILMMDPLILPKSTVTSILK